MKSFAKSSVLLLCMLLTIAVLATSSVYAQGDSDNDGMNDDLDACPFENGEGFRNEFGCLDDDRDDVEDRFDKCPNSVDLINRPVGADGCHDADGDGLTGDDDLCGNSAGPANTFGCPDTDGDGFAYDPDYVNQISNRDNCPDVPGPISGCPDPNATTDTTDTTTDTTTTDTTDTTTDTTDTTDTTTDTTDTTTPADNSPAPSPATSENCTTGRYLTTRLEPEGLGTVISDDSPGRLNFRTAPSTTAGVISVIQTDEVFVILDGPRCGRSPNLLWWNVYFEGRSGWIAESDGEEYLAKPVDVSPEATIIIADMLLTTVETTITEPDGLAYTYEQNPFVNLSCGTKITVIVSVPAQHTYTYADIINEALTDITVLESTSNDDDADNDVRLTEFIVTASGLYSLYGQSDVEGLFIAIIEPSTSIITGRGGAQPAVSDSVNCDDDQPVEPPVTGRGTSQTTGSNPAVQAAAAAAASNVSTCNNVAVGIVEDTPFGSANDGFILDGNVNTGWSATSIESTFFGVLLDGSQPVSSIELNGYSWTNTPENSVNEFSVTNFVGGSDPFQVIYAGVAQMQPGFVRHAFTTQSLDSVWIFVNSNHGGTNFELSDIRVCAD